MTYPKTCRSFRRSTGPYPLSVVQATETLPDTLGPQDVVIRVHAVALNYRDVAMLQEGRFGPPIETGGIPANDCAAEVVATGESVRRFVVGDRVTLTIDLAHLTGEERDTEFIATGGNGPGVLTEYAVFEDKYLAKLPKHLSWEEAATIPCCGTTAWVALEALKYVKDDTTVLLQGTGGVSMFALLLCLTAGMRPIITSSSDVKLDEVKKLSPKIGTINYKKRPNVVAEVLDLTDGKGVDYVLNVTGMASIPSDIEMLRKRKGCINLIGFLEGLQADWKPNALLPLLHKAARIQGVLGGSRADMEALNKYLEENEVRLEPLIDRTFVFEEAPAAFEYLKSAKHIGKVLIRL